MAFQRALFLLVASALTVVKAADADIAKCNSTTGYDWTENSLEQSPCFVGSRLGAVCNSGDFTIDALDPGLVYIGPTADVVTNCRCSTVFYSMLSSCAACQGRQWLEWTAYAPNCTTVFSQTFPGDIPPNVNVPGWAYLDVVADNQWNDTRSYAYLQSNPAESEGITQSTAGPSSTGGSSGSSSAASPSQSQGGNNSAGEDDEGDNNNSGGKKSNAGAIAGGVVGGVVGLALIGFLIWFFLRRRNRNKYATTAQTSQSAPVSPQMANYHQPFAAGGDPYGSPAPQKLYDPADPTTFPGYQGSNELPHEGGTTYSGPTAVDHRTSYAQPVPQGPPRPAYTGAAEI